MITPEEWRTLVGVNMANLFNYDVQYAKQYIGK
jgi:hypothetical protein